MRLGRYELVERIAVGGMAEIFIARETGLAGFQRRAVVKRILPGLAQDEEFVQLFLDEARLAARLAHPNIVHIYELGHDGESYYIAMEYVHGSDLGTLLDAMGGPLPVGDALHIVSDVLEGLHFAHTLCDAEGEPLGVVHRDVAPKNVLLSVAGVVKIVDFGIAKARTKVSVTMPGRVMGTVGYMSPEQLAGRPVDRRADVFATGAMLYRMVTGADAFPHRTALTIGPCTLPPLRPPREVKPDLPEIVEQVILGALAMDPDERYGTAAQMRRDLASAALKLGLSPDPDLLAGLVRTFMPEERRELSLELKPPPPEAVLTRPASPVPSAVFELADELSTTDRSVSLEVDVSRAFDLEPEEVDHRSSSLPEAPEKADPAPKDDDEARETLPTLPPARERGQAGPRLPPASRGHPRFALDIPRTVASRAHRDAEEGSVDILDEPPRDTAVDLGGARGGHVDPFEPTAPGGHALLSFSEPDCAEKTIDESTSVDLDIDVRDDDERTTTPETRR